MVYKWFSRFKKSVIADSLLKPQHVRFNKWCALSQTSLWLIHLKTEDQHLKGASPSKHVKIEHLYFKQITSKSLNKIYKGPFFNKPGYSRTT